MTERQAKAALHAVRASADGKITVELLGPMLQQFDLLALSDALEASTASQARDAEVAASQRPALHPALHPKDRV